MSPPKSPRAARLGARTIEDFGRQWTHFTGNEGWYGSLAFLEDVCGPLLDVAELRGARVADVGSGTGRIVAMLLEAGVAHVHAVEPSAAMDVLLRGLGDRRGRVTPLRTTGDRLPPGLGLDFAVSIGVLHHVPDPGPVLQAMRAALAPGGRVLIWVYGREGNGAYLMLARPLRAVTKRLPHRALLAVASGLERVLAGYERVCARAPARWPLPLRGYLLGTLGPLSREQRRLVVYDQLNPAHARYYRGPEVRALLEAAGFRDVRLHHRHGYSWTAVAARP